MSPLLFLLLLYLAPDDPADPKSRAEEIEGQRVAKAQQLAPDEPGKGERMVVAVQNNPLVRTLIANPSGFRVRVGGLVAGGGFAVGPEYYRPDLHDGDIVFRASARASIRKYQRYDVELKFPHLLHDHATFELSGTHFDYPSINYFGPGPDSKRSGRSDFKLENTSFDALAALKPVHNVKIGLTAGYLLVNVGPGTDDRFIDTAAIYPPSVTPGINVQSNFLRFGPAFEFDYRDRPGDPHKGGMYRASYLYYDDRKLNTGNHRKFSAEAQQYIPFFNEKRVFMVRGRTDLSYRNTNQVVPFYLQPTLGGSDDLRGFRPFRFYDNNSIVLNGEYRWEVMTGFDMALFSDFGKVFHRHADLDLTGLERSFGFGLRFSSRENVFMRIDTGFSREGFQVWIKFGNIFY